MNTIIKESNFFLYARIQNTNFDTVLVAGSNTFLKEMVVRIYR